jgi:hypothetical protein
LRNYGVVGITNMNIDHSAFGPRALRVTILLS